MLLDATRGLLVVVRLAMIALASVIASPSLGSCCAYTRIVAVSPPLVRDTTHAPAHPSGHGGGSRATPPHEAPRGRLLRLCAGAWGCFQGRTRSVTSTTWARSAPVLSH
jgi:hypothetical protein